MIRKTKACGERDETVNFIISEGSKLAQNGIQNEALLSGNDDPLGIVQEIKL